MTGQSFGLLLIVLCGAAVFLLLRIILSPERQDAPDSYDAMPSHNPSLWTQHYGRPGPATADLAIAPVASSLGRVSVTQFNFTHFDAVPGPPDPESFADELILELYDSASDFRWTTTYVVATPTGIRKLMDDERWSFFYATEIFIVRRYDLPTIREAVFGRIKEIHEQVPLDAEGPPTLG